MSGGHWDYFQFQLNSFLEKLENFVTELETNEEYKNCYEPKDIDVKDLFYDSLCSLYTDIKEAEHLERILDWYLSGDDGEDSFVERLKENEKVYNDVVSFCDRIYRLKDK